MWDVPNHLPVAENHHQSAGVVILDKSRALSGRPKSNFSGNSDGSKDFPRIFILAFIVHALWCRSGQAKSPALEARRSLRLASSDVQFLE